ncbi:siderophore-interacting protein [Microbacterium gorillae]|uniref:siderophore-interacting protein n=1 Tax=Microbacterium gorillae TaxID=1231063 RepID=UPI003D9820EA
MPHGFDGAVLRVLGAKEHALTVRGVTRLAPHFTRVHFDAPTLFQQATDSPAAWIRLWIEDPMTGVDFQRAYTIAAADVSEARLEVDFLLHEPAGPASAWASSASAGDRVVAQSLGSTSFTPAPDTSGLVLIGDAAGVPAINSILRSLDPQMEVRVLLERSHEEDELIPLASHPGAVVSWVPRDGSGSLALAAAEILSPGTQVWAVGETGSLKALRPAVKERAAGNRKSIHVQAYWIEGRAMGKERRV